MWTVLTWIFYPLLSRTNGYLGTSIASLLVGISSFVVWWLSQKYFKVNLFKITAKPFFYSLIILFLGLLLNSNLYVNIFVKLFILPLVYLVLTWLFSKSELIWFIRQLPWFKK
jgi:hypothetical protein